MSELEKVLNVPNVPHMGNKETCPARIVEMTGDDLKKFIDLSISEWRGSPEYKLMVDGQRYFENNTDILTRTRHVIGLHGEKIPLEHLSNNRLAHAYLRKLTKQKIGYLLSKPFTVSSDNKDFQTALSDYFNKKFYKTFKNCGQEAVVRGLGWLQIYYDEKGVLSFKRIPSTEIVPFWRDIDHTELDALIRVYKVDVFDGTEKKTEEHIQYFTPDIIRNYIRDKDGLKENADTPTEANFSIMSPVFNEKGEPQIDENGLPQMKSDFFMWNKIPFVPLKYNSEEIPLIKFIKSLTDNYDSSTSNFSNSLDDEPDKVKIVKNYDGTEKEQFAYNLARLRTVFVRDNGGVDTIDTSISPDAMESHLKRLKEDIYEFGGGVDTQRHSTVGNVSGKALKFIYADLDMDCADFGAELAWALEEIAWFIKQDILLKNKKDYTAASLDVMFNTDIAINETETMDIISKSVGILSDRTLIEQHPYVTDPAEELRRVKEQRTAELAETESRLNATNPTLTASESNNKEADDETE
jgi:SPP1 family phage portal protein